MKAKLSDRYLVKCEEGNQLPDWNDFRQWSDYCWDFRTQQLNKNDLWILKRLMYAKFQDSYIQAKTLIPPK